jgi:uncharacterized membrane protein YeaQ/YmgE (transglycosylase-associated protein family)
MEVTINIGQVVVWVIIGLLAGSLAGRLLRDRKRGFGTVGNLIVGLLGAVVGGFLWQLFEIDPLFPDIVITLDDVIAAFVGSIIVLVIIYFIRR